jgi:hypothetical protein
MMKKKVLSHDMQRGTELEPIASSKLKELKELEFIDVQEKTFFVLGDQDKVQMV